MFMKSFFLLLSRKSMRSMMHFSSKLGISVIILLYFFEMHCFLFIASQLNFERCPPTFSSHCHPRGLLFFAQWSPGTLRALPQTVPIAGAKTGQAAVTDC